MSITRIAVRQCVVGALTAKTLAGDNVNDSQIGEIDKNAEESEQPFIAVYTDDQSSSSLDVIIEFVVSVKMMGDDDVVATGMPATDAGIELMLDAIESQIKTALKNPGNEWGQLFETFMPKGREWKSERGATDEGIRFAARRITISGNVLADPTFGKPVVENSVWEKLFSLMDGLEPLHQTRDLIKSLMGMGDVDIEHWFNQQRADGLARVHADALLITPYVKTAPPNTVFTEITGEAKPKS